MSRKRGGRRGRAARAGSVRREIVVDPFASDWIEYGGVEMFVIGYTEGGAPYGLTREEYEQGWDDDRDGDEHNASSTDHYVSGRATPQARPSVETPVAERPDERWCESVSVSERGEPPEQLGHRPRGGRGV